MRPRRTLLRALAPVLLTGLVLAGCGDDDDEAAGTTTTTAADTTTTTAAAGNGDDDDDGEVDTDRYCQQLIDIEATFAEGPAEDPGASEEDQQAAFEAFGEQVEPDLQALEEDAPEEIAEPISTLADIVRSVLAGERAPDFVFEPDYRGADAEVDEWMVDNCGYDVQDITGVDYAYEGVPDEIEAGAVGFTFSNEGEEFHEMVVFRIEDPDIPIEELLEQEGEPEGVEFVVGAFAAQGESDTVFRDLEEGRHAMVCFLPVGTIEPPTGPPPEGQESGPPHFTQGMVAEFQVTG
jgi:hypothetical protein